MHRAIIEQAQEATIASTATVWPGFRASGAPGWIG